MGFKCEKCGSFNTFLMGEMLVCFPSEWYRNLTRERMMSKDFSEFGVYWDKMDVICNDCGYVKMRH